MLEFFTGFFTNIFNIVMCALFIVIGILVGLILKPRAKNQVMKILTRDKRFIDFDIVDENAFSVECARKKGFPPQRFIKYGAGFTGKVGKFMKKAVTRFLAKEGTAFTWTSESKLKELGSLGKALKGLWGLEFYNTIPEGKRVELEASKINVTVNLEDGFTPEGLPSVSEEQIYDEQDRKGAQTWWEGKKQSEKGDWIQWMFIFLAGCGAMAVASKLLGWW